MGLHSHTVKQALVVQVCTNFTAPETAPLKAPSANPSKNEPPFTAAAIPPTLLLSILRPMLPECSCQYDSQYTACQRCRYPQPGNNYCGSHYLGNGFPILFTPLGDRFESVLEFFPAAFFTFRF